MVCSLTRVKCETAEDEKVTRPGKGSIKVHFRN